MAAMGLGYDGSIRIDSRIDTKGFNAGILSMTRSLKGLAAAMGVAFGLAAVINFGKGSVAAASEMGSALIGLQSILDGTGKSFSNAQKFINDYIADGLMPATDAITAYKNLALRGYSDEQIQRTLLALKDSAAFGRQASRTMGEAVSSATEGLKNENSILVDNAGVTKNVSKMWLDYARSIGKSVTELTKEEKIQAEVAGIMEETRFQTGDAAKLTETYAGKVARLSAAFRSFQIAFGKALIPILARIIPMITVAIEYLTRLANTFGAVMEAIFGKQAAANQAAVAGTQDAAEAQTELAAATEDSKDAAKGALAAFDDLNVLSQKEEAGISDAGIPTPTDVASEVIPPDVVEPELLNKVTEFKNKLLEVLGPVSEAFGRLQASLAPLGASIWEGLKWGWDNVLEPLGKWTVTEVLPRFFDLLGEAGKILNEVLIALKPLAMWLWEEFLKPAGEWVGQALLDALDWMIARLKDFSQWIRENQEVVQAIAVVLGIFGAAWLIVTAAVTAWTFIAGVATAVTGAFAAVIAFLTSPIGIAVIAIGILIAIIALLIIYWDDVKAAALQVWDRIVEAWNNAGEWFRQHVTEPIKQWFTETWDGVKERAQTTWDGIVQKWQDAKTWFHNHVTAPIGQFFVDAWTAVTDTWSRALGWFEENVTNPVRNAFETVTGSIQETWERVFGGLGEFLRGVVNTAIGLLNSMLTSLVNGMNGVISGMNNLNITIPDWVPVYGGSAWGLNIPYLNAPQIPYLATGAVIPPNSEFLAVLGDQRSGRNIEAPENLLRQIVAEEIGQIKADIKIEFGGTMGALVKALKPEIDRESVRIGSSLIQGGVSV